jgi:hypothetical protein
MQLEQKESRQALGYQSQYAVPQVKKISNQSYHSLETTAPIFHLQKDAHQYQHD